MHRGGWGLETRLQNADTCVSKEPKYRGLVGEATECRLCKHCGCMLNTDYIWLHKWSSSERIDLHTNQKQEINFVWPNSKLLSIDITMQDKSLNNNSQRNHEQWYQWFQIIMFYYLHNLNTCMVFVKLHTHEGCNYAMADKEHYVQQFNLSHYVTTLT